MKDLHHRWQPWWALGIFAFLVHFPGNSCRLPSTRAFPKEQSL